MSSIVHLFHRLGLVFSMILPAGCGTNAHMAHSSAELASHYSPYAASPQSYLSQAAHSANGQKQDYQLLAAGSYLTHGDSVHAEQLLASIETQDNIQTMEKQILIARLYLLRKQASMTISSLATVTEISQLNLYYQCEYHELLALAYQKQNQTIQAAMQRIKLDGLLKDSSLKLDNRNQMWALMQSISNVDLQTQMLEAEPGTVWKGWVELAQIMKQNAFNEKFAQWAARYPEHPALSIIKKPSNWSLTKPTNWHQPQKIALLLPVSGALAGPGVAVKEGFMDAYGKAFGQAEVLVYDSNLGAVSQYHKAIDEGCDVVIGPLTKPDAFAVASTYSSTPTLLLNDVNKSLSSSKYAFGYSPKDEAMQVAHMMAEKSYHKVMMIIPGNAWGKEVSQAFSDQAFKDGLQIVSTLTYTDGQNLSQSLRYSLGYQEHKTKDAKGRQTMEMTRRQDVDAIFLLAYPSMARQILPLLKFYYAGDIPVYATSAAYSADFNPGLNRDLDGLYFVDIPWVFNHQLGNKAWPETWNTYNRLYALGFDSYELLNKWQSLQSMPNSGISEQTGVLYVMPNGHIRRELRLGQIRQGVARDIN
jgi:outer membrane PBP1 activator LpoA protein